MFLHSASISSINNCIVVHILNTIMLWLFVSFSISFIHMDRNKHCEINIFISLDHVQSNLTHRLSLKPV